MDIVIKYSIISHRNLPKLLQARRHFIVLKVCEIVCFLILEFNQTLIFWINVYKSVLPETTHQAYLESMTWSVKRLLPASIWTAGLTLTRYFVQMEGGRPNDPILHSISLCDVWKGYFWLDYYYLLLVWASSWKICGKMHKYSIFNEVKRYGSYWSSKEFNIAHCPIFMELRQ